MRSTHDFTGHAVWRAVLLAVLCLTPAVSGWLSAGEENKPEAAPVAADAAAEGGVEVVVIEEGGAFEEGEAQTYFDAFVQKFNQGGITMYLLLLLSVAGISCIIERLVNLNRGSMSTPGLAEKANSLYRQGKFDELDKACREDKSALGRIILSIVEHRECSRADVQSISDDIGSREVRVQLQKAYPLAIIATLSPLLGLFGTVFGMIGAFDTVAQAGDMGNAAILADDIAKALVTTAGGLMVAIPMLGFYHYFKSQTNRYAIMLEEDAGELFSLWFLRGQKEVAAPASGCGCGCGTSASAGEGQNAL